MLVRSVALTTEGPRLSQMDEFKPSVRHLINAVEPRSRERGGERETNGEKEPRVVLDFESF